MTKLYLSLRYTLAEERFEDAYTALADVEHLGIAEMNDELTISFLHDGSEHFQLRHEKLLQERFARFQVPALLVESQLIKEENWNKEWEDSIEPVWVNERIVVTPSWKQETVSAPLKIIINPQMSFGTGHHETTRMVANLLEQSVRTGDFWIDAGTGTGLLAILALKLGAQRVYAFDNDEWSVMNTGENFTHNLFTPVPPIIIIEQQDINTLALPPCNGITANLHKNLLLQNIKSFANALREARGTLIVSGLLKYDKDIIIDTGERGGFTHIQTINNGEWIAIKFTVSI